MVPDVPVWAWVRAESRWQDHPAFPIRDLSPSARSIVGDRRKLEPWLVCALSCALLHAFVWSRPFETRQGLVDVGQLRDGKYAAEKGRAKIGTLRPLTNSRRPLEDENVTRPLGGILHEREHPREIARKHASLNLDEASPPHRLILLARARQTQRDLSVHDLASQGSTVLGIEDVLILQIAVLPTRAQPLPVRNVVIVATDGLAFQMHQYTGRLIDDPPPLVR